MFITGIFITGMLITGIFVAMPFSIGGDHQRQEGVRVRAEVRVMGKDDPVQFAGCARPADTAHPSRVWVFVRGLICNDYHRTLIPSA